LFARGKGKIRSKECLLAVDTTSDLRIYLDDAGPIPRIGVLSRSKQMAASILAVDDSASMRQMVSFTLKGAGYDVVEAADGVEALNIAKTRSVNLVITDVNMPNMDGISLIRELRSLPSYKLTPLLMLTTESGADKKQQGKAAGATGWIVKPFNPEQLLKTVSKVIS